MDINSNIENYSKLGLAGSYEASLLNNLVDRTPQKSSKLKRVFLDIENVGTNKFLSPRSVLRYQSENRYASSASMVSYATWKLPVIDDKYYNAEYTIYAPIHDNFGLINFGFSEFLPEDNSYYRTSLKLLNNFRVTEDPVRNPEWFSRIPWEDTHSVDVDTNSYQLSGIYRPSGFARNDLDFARIAFEESGVNTSSILYLSLLDMSNRNKLFSETEITGYVKLNLNPRIVTKFNKYFNTGVSGANVTALSKRFSSSLYPKNYITGNYSLTSSIQNGYYSSGFSNNMNYSKYHIPYPITIDKQNFYRLNVATKIARISSDFQINGLLLISTGNAENGTEKVCYISPHVVVPKTVNIIEDFPQEKIKMQMISGVNSQVVGLFNDSHIFQANILSLTSEFAPAHRYGSGIVSQNVQYVNPSITLDDWIENNLSTQGLQVFNTVINTERRFCPPNGHLQQTTPLKDTPYYKFYNHLYSGAKTLATGTWNGIIPSGAFVNVELVTTTLGHKPIGTNHHLYIVYSGQGSFDNLDKKLYHKCNLNNYKTLFPRVEYTEDNLSFKGKNTSFSNNSAIALARTDARQNVNKMINKFIRYNFPELIIENRTARKFKIYKQKLYNQQLNNLSINKIPNDYIIQIEEN